MAHYIVIKVDSKTDEAKQFWSENFIDLAIQVGDDVFSQVETFAYRSSPLSVTQITADYVYDVNAPHDDDVQVSHSESSRHVHTTLEDLYAKKAVKAA